MMQLQYWPFKTISDPLKQSVKLTSVDGPHFLPKICLWVEIMNFPQNLPDIQSRGKFIEQATDWINS